MLCKVLTKNCILQRRMVIPKELCVLCHFSAKSCNPWLPSIRFSIQGCTLTFLATCHIGQITLHFCFSREKNHLSKNWPGWPCRYAPNYRFCRTFHRLPHHEIAPENSDVHLAIRTPFAIQNVPLQFSFLEL